MKRIMLGLLSVILFLIACAGTPPLTQPTVDSVSKTPTPSPLPSPTPTITVTPLPTIPTFTPTFDISSIVTVTPAPKAECPKEDQSLKLSFSFSDSNIKYQEEIFKFLNSGGSIQTILGALPSSFSYPHTIRLEDITGDEIPELMYVYSSGFSKFYIFTCSEGKYKIFEGKAESILIEFYGVFDMNLNNSPELVVVTRSCSGGGCWRYYVLEWNGNTYIDLSPDAFVDDVLEERIVDINNDGFLEIVARTAPVPFYVSQPWREELHIFSWDGNAFVAQIVRGYQPDYRFHAIQDADLETSLGDYDTALNLYNQVISNGNLDWWSRERQKFEQSKLDSLWEHTPTPSVEPVEDITEYPRLAAYAYYRIILIQLVQNQETEATTTYNTLQQEFGNAPYARPYVEMTSAFWEAYQSTHKMYDGCAAAIQYAVEHPEILTPLGSDYHGSQSHIYVPEDVCPFR